jgi:putative membrane protein
MVLVVGAPWGSARERGALALRLYRWLATPGMVLALVGAIARIVPNYELYFVVTHFMHGKLLFGLIAVALHHVLGAKARAMASGRVASVSGGVAMGAVFLLMAVGATILAVTKPF